MKTRPLVLHRRFKSLHAVGHDICFLRLYTYTKFSTFIETELYERTFFEGLTKVKSTFYFMDIYMIDYDAINVNLTVA